MSALTTARRWARLTFNRQVADEAFVKASIEFAQAETEWIKLHTGAIAEGKNLPIEQFLAERKAMRTANEAREAALSLVHRGQGKPTNSDPQPRIQRLQATAVIDPWTGKLRIGLLNLNYAQILAQLR